MYIKEDYKKDLISALNNEFYYSRICLSTETYWYDHLVPLKVFLPESKIYYCFLMDRKMVANCRYFEYFGFS